MCDDSGSDSSGTCRRAARERRHKENHGSDSSGTCRQAARERRHEESQRREQRRVASVGKGDQSDSDSCGSSAKEEAMRQQTAKRHRIQHSESSIDGAMRQSRTRREVRDDHEESSIDDAMRQQRTRREVRDDHEESSIDDALRQQRTRREVRDDHDEVGEGVLRHKHGRSHKRYQRISDANCEDGSGSDSDGDECWLMQMIAQNSRKAKEAEREAAVECELRVLKLTRTADEALKELSLDLSCEQERSARLAAHLMMALKERCSGDALHGLLSKALSSGMMTSVNRETLEHILRHITRPNAPYSPFMQDFSNHFANVLGMSEFLTLSNILGLPKETWIKDQRRILREMIHVGWMFRQIDVWVSQCPPNQLKLEIN